MTIRRARQLTLPVPATRGGRRPGAGRKPNGPRPGVSHRVRPFHDRAHPTHVTLRARRGLPSLRLPHVFRVLREALRLASHDGFGVVQFSVQGNHVHMIVEAKSRHALIRGVQGLAIRLARAINRALVRRGAVWADRYHARALTSPREVRNAIVYVLMNVRKHQPAFRGLDPCSSALWFASWADQPAPMCPRRVDAPVAAARTWLLRVGWCRHGLIDLREAPAHDWHSSGMPSRASSMALSPAA